MTLLYIFLFACCAGAAAVAYLRRRDEKRRIQQKLDEEQYTAELVRETAARGRMQYVQTRPFSGATVYKTRESKIVPAPARRDPSRATETPRVSAMSSVPPTQEPDYVTPLFVASVFSDPDPSPSTYCEPSPSTCDPMPSWSDSGSDSGSGFGGGGSSGEW